ncbi:cytochrome c oxidase assembly protein COX18, mitochondrial [Venturia canescens]|uniref:cytochrome c oxidase assembly protein COX18, mitochondrial n=1 Tax=Venturia canescens TaxID=32260 RepID=UPI001C9BC42E|nr:cytochrome c oxidase assembly protein COX18, mitochondrial [Venturia canescens]XP_043273792.1 cytochrome c oxidase assembly protein COX18, mitochondrial [Venturia canescens]
MNTLKTVQKLSLRDCYRVPYPNFKVNLAENSKNIQIKIIQKLRKFCVVSASEDKEYDNARNFQSTSIIVTNIDSKSLNKVTSFTTLKNEKKCSGLFSQHNSILSPSDPNFHYINVRRFSDKASEAVITFPHAELSGIWKSVAESSAVEYVQSSLIWLHTTTGLPWWATIILATASFRMSIIFPLTLYQHYIGAKYFNLRPDIDKMVKELKMETNFAVHQYKWSESYARAVYNRSFKKQKQKLIEKENCHPMKTFILAIVQIPMWITLTTALRNLCFILPYHTENARTIYLELMTGGVGWITNLTVPDSTFIIPVTLGLLNLLIIEMQQHSVIRSKPTKAGKILTNTARVFSLVMVPIAAYVPSGVSLYWVTSSAIGVAQNLIVVSPSLRRLVGIPPTEVELEKPYSHIYSNFRRKIGLGNVVSTENVKTIANTQNTIKHP